MAQRAEALPKHQAADRAEEDDVRERDEEIDLHSILVRLRPGTTADSAEAAEQLLRTPGALLLVDGYNISHAVWWDQPIAVQRDRLVSALAELHARTGIEVDVVFDGAEVERGTAMSPRPAVAFASPSRRRGRRRHHRACRPVPISRTVIVASSDRRVRTGRTATAPIFSALDS